MDSIRKLKGSWIQRFSIFFLSIILGLLLFWLLSFLTADIGTLPGPDYQKIAEKHVNTGLKQNRHDLEQQLAVIKEKLKNQSEQQRLLSDSTANLQNTINQLLDLQQQHIEKNLQISEQNRLTLLESQKAFIKNQKRYQDISRSVSDLTTSRQQLEEELSAVQKQITIQEEGARKEYDDLMAGHRLKVAILKLAVLVPIFLVLSWFFVAKRTGFYGPVIWAAFIAGFAKISFVVHEYFPRKYFKYIALLVVLGIVLRLLMHVLRNILVPRKDRLVKQYQESYDRGRCPICGKPIVTELVNYAKTGKCRGFIVLGHSEQKAGQHTYTCPSCGTNLYEKCPSCSETRHTLLPFCVNCGMANVQADIGS